jgi:hypothetical protein
MLLFEVIKKIGVLAYEPKLPNTGQSFILLSISPYKAARYHNQQKPPPPPPVEIKEEQEYHVEPSLMRRKIAIFGTLGRISIRRRYLGTSQTSQTYSRTHHPVSCIQSKTTKPYQEYQSLLQEDELEELTRTLHWPTHPQGLPRNP